MGVLLEMTEEEAKVVVDMLDYCGNEPHKHRIENPILYKIMKRIEKQLYDD